jgi:glycosyltransferase involved in cell wall biosynthesis
MLCCAVAGLEQRLADLCGIAGIIDPAMSEMDRTLKRMLDFHIHNRADEAFIERNVRYANRKSKVIFVHSAAAKHQLIQSFDLSSESVRVIRHGDLSLALGAPCPKTKARAELGLGPEKIALMFGTVEPYKGLEEVITWWQTTQSPVRLAVIGRPTTPEYGSQILRHIGNAENILYRLDWLSDQVLRLWLSAADVVVFNYREIFTSGAASLARSFGIPLLLPRRLETVALDEPTPYVRRFTDLAIDFGNELSDALALQPDFAAAASWREACNWDDVAKITVDGYRYALG